MSKLLLQAVCLFGLERHVKEEIYDLGYDIEEVSDGRVTFVGDLEAVARANLHLRCAERVGIVLGRFPAATFEELYQGVLKIACVTAMIIMLLGAAIFLLLPDLLLQLFHPSAEFLRIGRSALRIICLHFPLAAIGIALGASFQALGNGIYSTIVSLCRQLIALLPAAYLLSLSGNVTLVWWSFPIAEVISVTVTLLFFRRIYRQKVLPLRMP